VGAGNSVGNFGLVGALHGAALATRQRTIQLPAAIVLIGANVLLVAKDIHGAALTVSATAAAAQLALSGRAGTDAS
jgi:hypothetical protein